MIKSIIAMYLSIIASIVSISACIAYDVQFVEIKIISVLFFVCSLMFLCQIFDEINVINRKEINKYYNRNLK